MWAFVGITVALFLTLGFSSAYMKREEIMANWSKYRDDPLYMFAAPMFKPADDPRSRLKFASDNFVDVLLGLLEKIFSVFLQPVFKIFGLFTGALTESLSGLFNIRALLGNMWNRFNEMTDIFMRRFNRVFHQLRLTFAKLLDAMDKTFAVAVSAVYEGISTIHTITSFIDLLIKIVIAILVIMVAMIIFLIFVLWPFIPMILLVVGIISTTALGGAVGGMAGTFCFTGSTQIHTADGLKSIREIKLGQVLHDNSGIVQGLMEFDVVAEDLYELYGVQVSGAHIVYTQNGCTHVREHPDAIKTTTQDTKLYCLITSNRKIPVASSKGVLLFADWEEIHTDVELEKWHRHVFTELNPGKPYINASSKILQTEAAVSKHTRVMTAIGPIEICEIRPGDHIMDAYGNQTRVTGIVRVAGSEISDALRINDTSFLSASTWMLKGGSWNHPANTEPVNSDEVWYSLFTESGSYKLCDLLGSDGIRDFTDIGPDHIHETYDWVLESLKSAR